MNFIRICEGVAFEGNEIADPLRLAFARVNMPLACLPPIGEAGATDAEIIYVSRTIY